MIIVCNDEASWLAERKKSVGGSDAPAVMGVGAYEDHTAFRVAAEKLGLAPPMRDSETLRWGHVLEPIIRREAERRFPSVITHDGPWTLRRDAREYMHASLDGVVEEDDLHTTPGVLQCKLTSSHPSEFEPGTPLRLAWDVQVQHEMAVTGFRWARMAVLNAFRGLKFHSWDVERNDAFIELLAERCREFMQMVARNELPKPDGSARARAILKHLHPRDNGKAVVLDVDAVLDFEEWDSNTRKETEARKKASEAYNRLLQRIGDNTYAVLPNGVRLAYRTQRNDVRVLRRDR